jgi:hypothetical protein
MTRVDPEALQPLPGVVLLAVALVLSGLSHVALHQAQPRLPSCGTGHAGLVLEDPGESMRYVVDVQAAPADDRQVIRLLERCAAERNRHGGSRCIAVLVATGIAPRIVNVLVAISGAVPVVAVEMKLVGGSVAFAQVRVG